MASGRMFNKQFVESDLFAFLSVMAQCLYFHLAMSADDEGYVSGVKRIIRALNINDAALDELKANGLVYEFASGICLILHWHQNNHISPTRRKPTTFVKEQAYVSKGVDDVYIVNKSESVASVFAQDRRDECSVGEASVGEASVGEASVGEASVGEASASANAEGEPENNTDNVSKGEGQGGVNAVTQDPAECFDLLHVQQVERWTRMLKDVGEGLVVIGQEDLGEMVRKMSQESFVHYVGAIANGIRKGHKYTQTTHAQAIFKMARSDNKLFDQS